MICLYFEDIFIHGVKAGFGDAVFTFYKITANKKGIPEDTVQNPLYHSHFYYECHILLEGETRYMIQGDTVFAAEGNMVIIPPHTEHYPFQKDGSARECVLGLMLEQTEQDSGEFQYFISTLCEIVSQPIPLSKELLDMIVHFYDHFQNTDIRENCFRQAAAYEIIVQLFDTVNQFHMPTSVPKAAAKDDNADITLEIMINDVQSTLQDIANALGYSIRHTSRLILRKYGKNLTEIRQRNMISTAKKFLTYDPSLSMEAVALQSGFLSMDAMTRAFRKWENTTPTEYKKGIKKA